jgi:hypothetical protein
MKTQKNGCAGIRRLDQVGIDSRSLTSRQQLPSGFPFGRPSRPSRPRDRELAVSGHRLEINDLRTPWQRDPIFPGGAPRRSLSRGIGGEFTEAKGTG